MSMDHPRSSHRPSRTWYHLDELVDEYHGIACTKGDGDLKMLKTLKIIRSILVIVAISAISVYALYLGAEPTLVAAFSLPSLAGYAGAEAADYAALVQGFLEAKSGQNDDDQDDENGDEEDKN